MTTALFVRHEHALQPADFGEELRNRHASLTALLDRREVVLAPSERRRTREQVRALSKAMRLLRRWEPCTPPATWHAGYLRSPVGSDGGRLTIGMGALVGGLVFAVPYIQIADASFLALGVIGAGFGSLLAMFANSMRQDGAGSRLTRLAEGVRDLPAARPPALSGWTEDNKWIGNPHIRMFTGPVPRWALDEAKRAEKIVGRQNVFVYSPRPEDFETVPIVIACEPAIIARCRVGAQAYYFEVARWDVTMDLAYLYATS